MEDETLLPDLLVGTRMTDFGSDSVHPSGTTDPGAAGTSRRTVLGYAALAGAGLPLLAACGGGGDDETPAGTTSSPSAGGESPSGSESDAGGGGGLVATADVPVGGGVILDEKKIVVTQPKSGDFKAFTAVCTHQSCTVSSVKNGTISCPCHGSTYSAADGSVTNGPATRPLRAIAISVEGDEIVKA